MRVGYGSERDLGGGGTIWEGETLLPKAAVAGCGHKNKILEEEGKGHPLWVYCIE